MFSPVEGKGLRARASMRRLSCLRECIIAGGLHCFPSLSGCLVGVANEPFSSHLQLTETERVMSNLFYCLTCLYWKYGKGGGSRVSGFFRICLYSGSSTYEKMSAKWRFLFLDSIPERLRSNPIPSAIDLAREVEFGRVGIRGLGVGISPVVGGGHYPIVDNRLPLVISYLLKDPPTRRPLLFATFKLRKESQDCIVSRARSLSPLERQAIEASLSAVHIESDFANMGIRGSLSYLRYLYTYWHPKRGRRTSSGFVLFFLPNEIWFSKRVQTHLSLPRQEPSKAGWVCFDSIKLLVGFVACFPELPIISIAETRKWKDTPTLMGLPAYPTVRSGLGTAELKPVILDLKKPFLYI
ncbi:hypothetical protein VNO77_46406 [Canavalia gladiata]|uniref:Uncharacterized protein n=1 Tax=Canavalia gladiata TaxID=3824 RepID=A0AAN9JJI6_CANGL